MFFSLAFAAMACTAASDPQQSQGLGGAPPKSANEIASKFRAEAARLETGHVSDFFSGLAKPDEARNRGGLSDEQAELVRQLDVTARDVLRAWLLRALERAPSQLSHKEWERKRARIVGHAEAIALEAVLTPVQARRWRTVASRPGTPPIAGRYPLIPMSISDDPPPKTLTRFRGAIWCEAQSLLIRGASASELFSVLLGTGKDAIPGLSAHQVELIGRLEKLARDVQRVWLLRCLDKEPPAPDVGEGPPTPAMEERLSDHGKRLRASIVAHAEAIALEAILTPDQAASSKRPLWGRRGVFALLDPELAAMLKISKLQQDEIATLLERRAVVYHRAWGSITDDRTHVWEAFGSGKITAADAAARDRRLVAGFGPLMGEFDQAIWEVLYPSQRRALAQLLGPPLPSRPAPKSNQPGPPG